MKRPLADDALADALLVGGEAPGCPDGSLFWALASGELAPDDVHRLLDHAAGCADCSLALRAARELRATSGLPLPERAQEAPVPTLWERLTTTVLAPRPALAYLLLAALLVPVALRERRSPETGTPVVPAPAPAAPSPVPPSLSLARVLQLTGDPELRGERPPSPPPSLGEGPVLLRLHVDPEDVAVGTSLTVRLFSGPEAIAELPVTAEARATGRIDVLVNPGAARPDRVEVVSGTAVVFRQSLAR